MLEVASEGIHVVNEQGVTVVYNKAASEFDGLLPEEVLGKHILDVFPSLTHDSSTLLRVLRNGVPEIAKQQTFTNYKGKKITTINSTYPITDGDKIIGACEISTDITRIKEMAERIADLRQELRIKECAEDTGDPGLLLRFPEIIHCRRHSGAIGGDEGNSQVVQVARTQSMCLSGARPALVRGWLSIHSFCIRKGGICFVAQNCAAPA